MKNKRINCILLSLVSLFAITLSACTINNKPSDGSESESETEPVSEETSEPETSEVEEPDLFGIFNDSDYLEVDGKYLVNQQGKNVYLHGVNAGGYLLTERWMCATRIRNNHDEEGHNLETDHLTLTNVLTKRFGKEKTLEIWENYRNNFWNDQDFQNCKDMKMNVIRLPFSYMSVDPAYNNVREIPGQEFNFELLDSFIEGCAALGLYVILDLHGAYGSQNGQDHSGQVISNYDDVDFYSNDEKKQKTVHLWEALAKRYEGIPSIAAYDILNEPGEKAASTTTRHWNFFDDVYKAIRKVDSTRPIIMESCWDGNNLPHPSTYEWESVVYSFHHYTNNTNASDNLNSYTSKLDGVRSQNFNVPYYMGEFTLYHDEASWKSILSYLNYSNWSWTSWTYKLNRHDNSSFGGWGIYYSHAESIYFDTDDFDTIMEKLHGLDTSSENSEKMTFDSSVTLERVMRSYC